MAKHDIDPVLRQLAQAINESGQAAVPIMVSVRGTVLNGAVISEQRYFSELVAGNPLMSALEPSSGLLGKDYTKDAEADGTEPEPLDVDRQMVDQPGAGPVRGQ